jgi:hypothetical protein
VVAQVYRLSTGVESRLLVIDPYKYTSNLSSGEHLDVSEKFANFAITSLCVWKIDRKEKGSKRYIAVGMAEVSGEVKDGKVVVFQLSTKYKGIRLRKSDEIKTPGPVYSLVPFESYLILTCGQEMFQIKIDANKRRLVLSANIPTKYKLHTIGTAGDKIFLCGNRSPILLYSFDKQKKAFSFHCTSAIPRNYATTLGIESDIGSLAFGMEKGGILTVYQYDPQTRLLEPILSHHLRQSSAKLVQGRLRDFPVSVPSDVQSTSFCVPWNESDRRIIYGLSNDGVLLAFARISDKVFQELFKLQELMSEQFTSLLGGTWKQFRQGNYGLNPSQNIIDGQFIRQFLTLTVVEKEAIVTKLRGKRFKPTSLLGGFTESEGEKLLGQNIRFDVATYELIISQLEKECIPSPQTTRKSYIEQHYV